MERKELQLLIKNSGLKKGYIAKKLRMHRITLSRKMHGHTEKWFSPPQMRIILKEINHGNN